MEASLSYFANPFIAEAFVPLLNARCVADLLCTRCYDHCLTVDKNGDDRLLGFEHAGAVLRPVDAGLQMRVEGQNLVVFCGVRTLLQGHLATVATVHAKAVEWQPAGCVPFRTDGTLL